MESYFQGLADSLMAGDLERVMNHYAFPLVVYERDGITIHKCPKDTVIRLAERLMSLRSGGADSVLVRLDHAGPPQNQRKPFDITKFYQDSQGQTVGISRLRYFCRIRDDRIKIELIEILEAYRMEAPTALRARSH